MAEEDWKPGVALGLVSVLLSLPITEQASEIDELLDAALTRAGKDPWHTETILEMAASRARSTPDAVVSFRRQQIEQWREAAESAEGILRFAHLEHALELARVYGLSDEADDLRRQLQDIGPEELDLKEVRAEVTIPSEQVETFVEALVGNNWRDGLQAIVAAGAPTGDPAANADAVRNQMQRTPFQFLISRDVLGPENTVVRRLSNQEEQFTAALAAHEQQAALLSALFLVKALKRMKDRYAVPDEDALIEFFTTDLVRREVAMFFARALLHFWAERYDEAVHVITPRIEAATRELARKSGVVVIREPVGERPGGVRSLGELLRDLRGRLDEPWRRYLWITLAEPLGLNLRNLVSHGLIDEGTETSAALLIQIACFLALLKPTTAS
jgi:hypothetical protein